MLGETNAVRLSRRRSGTRREILDAAWAVVRDDGWPGLTLRRVGERVGMRAPSLYGHFPSKSGIVDAMFAETWAELDARLAAAEDELPPDPRAALLEVGRLVVGFFTADPDRYALMSQRPVPGFVPTPEAYAPAVSNLDRLRAVFARLGVDDPDAIDLWTALISGIVNQQLANDPGGDRWTRLLPRAVEMYADEIGVPPARNRRRRS